MGGEAHMPKKQTKKDSIEETLSSIKKEMAKPRMAQSTREEFCKADGWIAREITKD
jgi:hypothetical protein